MNSKSLTRGEVMEQKEVAPSHFEMRLRLPLSFTDPLPGQFVMIQSAGHKEPLLARPLSVYGFSRLAEHSVLELLYRIAGEGTALLSRLRPGDPLTVLGPLGTGFSPPRGMKRALFIAGGVGVAPLTYLLSRVIAGVDPWQGLSNVFYLGAKTADLLPGLDRLAQGCDLRICTDDGSRGTRGLVTDLLAEEIAGYAPRETTVFACGPGPMIRSLGGLLADRSFVCQVSLEERMACGLGACLGCAIAIRNGQGAPTYQRVCKDGPVFQLQLIVDARPAGA